MKRTISKLMMASAALAVSIALMPLSAAAKKPNPDLNVDCDAGETIQSVLDGAKSYLPITINVRGTCEGDVLIQRDDVTIDGNHDTTVVGQINVFGGNRTLIRNLTVTGPGRGVQVMNGNADLYDLNVTYNALDGIWAIRESWVGVHDSVVSGHRFGAFVQNSTLEANDTEFTNNLWVGIQLDTGANAMTRSSMFHNNGQGVNAALHSVVELESGTEITGNGYGVYLAQDSGLRVDGPGVVIEGNSISDIFCNDSESSYLTRDNPLSGNINCTGFDQVAPTP